MEKPTLFLLPFLAGFCAIFLASSQAAARHKPYPDLDAPQAALAAIKAIFCTAARTKSIEDHMPAMEDHLQDMVHPAKYESSYTSNMQERKMMRRLEEEGLDEDEDEDESSTSALGSKPPNCNAKCASCKPCTPVKVPVPPGSPASSNSAYYPEAWRCKCRGKLYMPSS